MSDRSSTTSTIGAMSAQAPMNPSMLIGSPSIAMRSRMSSTCGEVNRPVRKPSERSSASIIRDVLVLPFVPVTCTTG